MRHSFDELQKRILALLKQYLSPNLTYHGLHHTLDVLNVCNQYIERYKLSESESQKLRIGGLTHDIGFINVYSDHEEEGKRIVSELLPQYGYSQEFKEDICGLIEATKIPQKPTNFLEEIIADADLDYLGRADFYHIGESLYEELKWQGVLGTREEWNELQIRFLSTHNYFTPFAKENRAPQKQERLKELQGKECL